MSIYISVFQPNYKWQHSSSRCVTLEPTNLLLLHDFERAALQKLALSKLKKSDLGGANIRIPKGKKKPSFNMVKLGEMNLVSCMDIFKVMYQYHKLAKSCCEWVAQRSANPSNSKPQAKKCRTDVLKCAVKRQTRK